MAPTKMHGRAFYQSIGSPKHVLAPMVDASEFAWRMLTRSFVPEDERRSILTYSPMLHAKLFSEKPKYRREHFKALKEPNGPTSSSVKSSQQEAATEHREQFLDGHTTLDRPLFVQFCANEPEVLLQAAKHVQPFCDAVDLNLGCPQGIAKRGNYGAFLQEDWDTIYKMINLLHKELDIPVTAKMRVLETREKTLEYAKMILSAGASIITVHGRRREQKGHNTGLADWSMIRFLRDNLPPETVIFANGNILQHEDIDECLKTTGADAVMSAEGNLYDPAIFALPPPAGTHEREYWRGEDGLGGWRCDAVVRRYFDIIHSNVLGRELPERAPLWIPSDGAASKPSAVSAAVIAPESVPTKKQHRKEAKTDAKHKHERPADINLLAMQAHLFNILRALVKERTEVRDQLARTRSGDMDGYENVLRLVEEAVAEGIAAYEADPIQLEDKEQERENADGVDSDSELSSRRAVRRCRRPWFVCQPYVRPLPSEAVAKGAMQLSKKEIAKRKLEDEEYERSAKIAKVAPHGRTETEAIGSRPDEGSNTAEASREEHVEIPREGLVCG